MNQLKDKVRLQANNSLEAVEYASGKVEKQTNKNLLPRIKKIVIEIGQDNYEHFHEFKGIISVNPEGSAPDSDIFLMDAQGGGLMLPLGSFLSELKDLVENFQEEQNTNHQ